MGVLATKAPFIIAPDFSKLPHEDPPNHFTRKLLALGQVRWRLGMLGDQVARAVGRFSTVRSS